MNIGLEERNVPPLAPGAKVLNSYELEQLLRLPSSAKALLKIRKASEEIPF